MALKKILYVILDGLGDDPLDALAKIIVLGTPADISSVWVGGQVVNGCTPTPFTPKVPLTTSS